MSWHIVITEEMRAMGLTGNDLVVYALINGFSQNGQGCFFGSINYICETCGIARRTAMYILASLVERGFLEKTDTIKNGVKSVTYVCKNCTGGVQKLHGGCAKIAPNNISYNKSKNLYKEEKKEESERFSKPTLAEVEAYCVERNNINAQAFFDYYESNGWRVGHSAMKDWRAAVRSWEQRRKENGTDGRNHTPNNFGAGETHYPSSF